MPELHKLYLDQMLALDVAEELRGIGHNVLRASEIGQSRADDDQILKKVITENRVLVTLDGHFGDWVILPLKKHPGVIRIKVHPTTGNNITKILIPFLNSYSPKQLKDHLVILSPKREKWIRTS
jgi:predicted nuclease of predicted toxin-antitoxin system